MNLSHGEFVLPMCDVGVIREDYELVNMYNSP